MLKKVANLIKKVVGQKKEKHVINATQSFQTLMHATAAALDARKEGIQTGIIPPSMPTEEIIPYLYSLYVFMDYEKKFSPIIAGNLLKIYCPKDFSIAFEFYYKEIAKSKGMNLYNITFDNDLIEPFIDISSFAKKSIDLGFKRHWNPFKEPYRSEWDSCFLSNQLS